MFVRDDKQTLQITGSEPLHIMFHVLVLYSDMALGILGRPLAFMGIQLNAHQMACSKPVTSGAKRKPPLAKEA